MTGRPPLAWALEFIGRGWQPVPIPFREKKPVDDEWQRRVITAETAPQYFNSEAQNIGVALGRVSGGLCDVDLDTPEAIVLAPAFLPPTPAIFGRASKPRSHWLYVTDLCDTENQAAIQLREKKEGGGNGPMVAELRTGGNGKGAQTVFPGSTHKDTGEEIVWASDGEPARVDGAELKKAFHKCAAAALLVRHYPGEGSRHDAALSLVGMLARCNWPAEVIENFVGLVAQAAHDEEWKERGKSAKDTVEKLQRDGPIPGKPRFAKDWGKPVAEKFLEWLDLKRDYSLQPDAPQQLMWQPKGGLYSNVGNALVLLESEPVLKDILAYDEMLCMPILRHPVPRPGEMQAFCEPRPVQDEDATALQHWLQWRGLRTISGTAVWAAMLKRAYDRAFHPVRDYLDALVWDGKPRIGNWLFPYFEVEDTEYSQEVGKLFILSMVARIYRPGCKADCCLVLEGPEGILKSQACEILAGPKYFSQTLPDITREKDAMQHLRGLWLIEIAELHPIKRAEVSQLKNFLSTKVDRFRPSYGRADIWQPRQCVFVGTTNEAQYLRSTTGNRRFWPVLCGMISIKALIRDRDQLFAEAVHCYKKGEHWWPTPAIQEALLAPEQEKRREADPWEAIIERWLADDMPGFDKNRFLVADVAAHAIELKKDRLGRAESCRIVACLIRAGCERSDRTGTGQYWTVPDAAKKGLERKWGTVTNT